MGDIDEKDIAKLVSMIYGPDLNKDLEKISEDPTVDPTVEVLVEKIEDRLKNIAPDEKVGGEMSKSEYQEILNQIKSSKTLMSMEIKEYKNVDETYFRAMTLIDPNDRVNPVVIFRGTAGNYQWDDNFSAMVSSRTPSQQEAQQYIIESGYDHLTVAGHSKGGNMAASMIYLLPEGMVDKVYSFDGQGSSNIFLEGISDEKINFAKESVFNINEYRDIVSQLMNKTGSDKNTTYIDSGVDFKDTNYGFFDFKMYLFHPHKPNYFLTKDAKDVGRSFVPSRIANYISKLDVNSWSKDKALDTLKFISSKLHTKEKKETAWSDELWNTVYEAEQMYKRVNEKRGNAILQELSELYGVDFSQFDLVQEKGSFVVEGAILTCPYCSGIGDLENIEVNRLIIQGKPVASKKDNKEENICMKDLECSAIDFMNAPEAKERICEPEICFEWVITEPNKIVTINGEDVEAVLKKSVLGCLRGGMIEVVYNGQMNGEDVVKKLSLKNTKKKQSIWEKITNRINDASDLQMDLWKAGSNVMANGGETIVDNFAKMGEDMKQISENAMEEIQDITEKISDGLNQISDSVIEGYTEAEKYIEDILQNKLNLR